MVVCGAAFTRKHCYAGKHHFRTCCSDILGGSLFVLIPIQIPLIVLILCTSSSSIVHFSTLHIGRLLRDSRQEPDTEPFLPVLLTCAGQAGTCNVTSYAWLGWDMLVHVSYRLKAMGYRSLVHTNYEFCSAHICPADKAGSSEKIRHHEKYFSSGPLTLQSSSYSSCDSPSNHLPPRVLGIHRPIARFPASENRPIQASSSLSVSLRICNISNAPTNELLKTVCCPIM